MDKEMLITVLTWLVIALGTGLVTSLIWFARRTVSQVDTCLQVLQRVMRRLSILELKAGIPITESDSDVVDP